MLEGHILKYPRRVDFNLTGEYYPKSKDFTHGNSGYLCNNEMGYYA